MKISLTVKRGMSMPARDFIRAFIACSERDYSIKVYLPAEYTHSTIVHGIFTDDVLVKHEITSLEYKQGRSYEVIENCESENIVIEIEAEHDDERNAILHLLSLEKFNPYLQ